MAVNNSPESVETVGNGLKAPENLVLENKALGKKIQTCSHLPERQQDDVNRRYPNIKIPEEVSADGKDELARRVANAQEQCEIDSEEPSNLGQKFIAKMDALTSPHEVIDPNSSKLNVAAQNTNIGFFEKSEGILAGNTTVPELNNVGTDSKTQTV